MIIRFDEMDLTVLPAFKGGEKEYRAKMFFDGSNRIMHGTLIPGASIGMHTHEDSSETIFIIKGHGTLIDDGETQKVSEGDCLYCPKGHTHSLINDSDSDLQFYAVVPMQ